MGTSNNLFIGAFILFRGTPEIRIWLHQASGVYVVLPRPPAHRAAKQSPPLSALLLISSSHRSCTEGVLCIRLNNVNCFDKGVSKFLVPTAIYRVLTVIFSFYNDRFLDYSAVCKTAIIIIFDLVILYSPRLWVYLCLKFKEFA